MKQTPIPCPLCGKRLFDFQGEACPNNFELSIKCRNKNCRIIVKIGAKYIEKQIASQSLRESGLWFSYLPEDERCRASILNEKNLQKSKK
jgi:hypothetical protein